MWQSFTLWNILRRTLADVTDTPEAEAREMLIAAAGVDPFHHLHYPVTREAVQRLRVWVRARKRGTPLAYLTGERPFLGLTFQVHPGVFIPRADSEVLVLEAEKRLKNHPDPRILDLGTGTGVLLLTLLHRLQRGKGTGLDRSPIALKTARQNALRLGLTDQTRWIYGDAAHLPFREATFDLVIANPPYVAGPHEMMGEDWKAEPPEALFSPGNGVAATLDWWTSAWRVLVPGGWVLMESSRNRKASLDRWFQERGLRPQWILDTGQQIRGWMLRRGQEEGVP